MSGERCSQCETGQAFRKVAEVSKVPSRVSSYIMTYRGGPTTGGGAFPTYTRDLQRNTFILCRRDEVGDQKIARSKFSSTVLATQLAALFSHRGCRIGVAREVLLEHQNVIFGKRKAPRVLEGHRSVCGGAADLTGSGDGSARGLAGSAVGRHVCGCSGGKGGDVGVPSDVVVVVDGGIGD